MSGTKIYNFPYCTPRPSIKLVGAGANASIVGSPIIHYEQIRFPPPHYKFNITKCVKCTLVTFGLLFNALSCSF